MAGMVGAGHGGVLLLDFSTLNGLARLGIEAPPLDLPVAPAREEQEQGS